MNPVFHDFWGSFVFLIAFVLLSLFNASMFYLDNHDHVTYYEMISLS